MLLKHLRTILPVKKEVDDVMSEMLSVDTEIDAALVELNSTPVAAPIATVSRWTGKSSKMTKKELFRVYRDMWIDDIPWEVVNIQLTKPQMIDFIKMGLLATNVGETSGLPFAKEESI